MQSQELQGELGGVPAVNILGYHQPLALVFRPPGSRTCTRSGITGSHLATTSPKRRSPRITWVQRCFGKRSVQSLGLIQCGWLERWL